MPQVTKEEVEFMKEASNLVKTVLPYIQHTKYKVIIRFDEKNGLPEVVIEKG